MVWKRPPLACSGPGVNNVPSLNCALFFFSFFFLVQVCFEIVSPLTIKKVVDNKVTYYASIDVLPSWTRPEQTENVPAISIWIDETQLLRKYEFQCSKSDKYSPQAGFEITDVRSVHTYLYILVFWVECIS